MCYSTDKLLLIYEVMETRKIMYLVHSTVLKLLIIRAQKKIPSQFVNEKTLTLPKENLIRIYSDSQNRTVNSRVLGMIVTRT